MQSSKHLQSDSLYDYSRQGRKSALFMVVMCLFLSRGFAQVTDTINVPSGTFDYTTNYPALGNPVNMVKLGAGTANMVYTPGGFINPVRQGVTTVFGGTLNLNRAAGPGNTSRSLPNQRIEMKPGTNLIVTLANQIGDATTLELDNATFTLNQGEYLSFLTMKNNSTINGPGRFVLNGNINAKLIALGGGTETISASFAMASAFTDLTTTSSARAGNGTTEIEVQENTILNIATELADFHEGNSIGSMRKTGSGKLVLASAAFSNYRGTTSIQAGEYQVNGTLRSFFWNGSMMQEGLSGNLTVNAAGKLSGTGTIKAVNTLISGTHAPGTSPGIQTFASDLTYNNGAVVELEFISNSATGRGTNFDGINLTSGADLNFAGATTFDLQFNGAGSMVDWSSSFWDSNKLGTNGWLLYSGVDTLSGLWNVTIS